jgi:hypothetical protein
MGMEHDATLEKAVEILYQKSDTFTPYGCGKFSLFKTTHLVHGKMGEKGFESSVKYKHLEWALRTSYDILKKYPEIETMDEYPEKEKYNSERMLGGRRFWEMFSGEDARGKLRIMMMNRTLKTKDERLSALLSEGKITGYWQYDVGFNRELKYLLKEYGGSLFDDGAKEMTMRLNATPNESEFMGRLSDFIDMGMFPTIGMAEHVLEDAWIVMEANLYHDLFSIYREKLRARKKGSCVDMTIRKGDVERALKRRYGFVLNDGETFEQLVPKKAVDVDEWS